MICYNPFLRAGYWVKQLHTRARTSGQGQRRASNPGAELAWEGGGASPRRLACRPSTREGGRQLPFTHAGSVRRGTPIQGRARLEARRIPGQPTTTALGPQCAHSAMHLQRQERGGAQPCTPH